MDNIDMLVKQLCTLPNETGWVEFKHNNCDPKMIGEDISALANSAVIDDRSHAYMIWGIDDKTHNIIGTNVFLKQEKKGNQEIENWLRYMLSKNADFEIQSVDVDGVHVEIIIISKAEGVPVSFEKVEYIRVGSYTKRVSEFPTLQAQLWDKLRHKKFEETYAISLEKAVKYVNAILPSKEDINKVHLTNISSFPLPAIREAIANALIHQDFFVTGAGPVVEIFENRVEVTNPGTPLVDIMRIIDNPPKSRNEKLATLMRRLKLCEELGRGWDRMVISCELQQLPAPRIQIYQEAMKVCIFSHLEYSNIPLEDKLWSLYLHTCVQFVQGNAMTNSSLRKRFGLKDTSAGSVSRLIRQAVDKKLVKPIDPETAQRYYKYIPIWG